MSRSDTRRYAGLRLLRANQVSGARVAATGRIASDMASTVGMNRD